MNNILLFFTSWSDGFHSSSVSSTFLSVSSLIFLVFCILNAFFFSIFALSNLAFLFLVSVSFFAPMSIGLSEIITITFHIIKNKK